MAIGKVEQALGHERPFSRNEVFAAAKGYTLQKEDALVQRKEAA